MTSKLNSGYSYQVFDELDSTNLEAKRQFQAATTKPKWILAKRQTAGYGRQNRRWSQDEGDFAGSLLLPLKDVALGDDLSVTSFAAAVAVDRTLIDLGIHERDLALKWPNDVLLKGAKLCGLLLEMIDHNGKKALIIGIGVNVLSSPEVSKYATARLADHLPKEKLPTVEQILKCLDRHLNDTLTTLLSRGFAPMRSAWLNRAYGIGCRITVRLPREERSGIFEGIDEEGALILRDDTVIHHINSGDVFFRSA